MTKPSLVCVPSIFMLNSFMIVVGNSSRSWSSSMGGSARTVHRSNKINWASDNLAVVSSEKGKLLRKLYLNLKYLHNVSSDWFHSSKDIWQTYMYNCQITSFANQYGQVGTQNKTYLPISPPPQPTLQDVRITEYRCTIVLISMFTILSFFFWVMNIQRISIFTKAKILFPKSKDLYFLFFMIRIGKTYLLHYNFTSFPFQ